MSRKVRTVLVPELRKGKMQNNAHYPPVLKKSTFACGFTRPEIGTVMESEMKLDRTL